MSTDSSRNRPKSLFIMVGDMSADKHTSKIVAKLKQLSPDLLIWGAGGTEMVAEGLDQVRDCAEFAVVGIVETLQQFPVLAQLRSQMVKEIAIRKPDAVLLVDFGGFNLGLAGILRQRHPELPILYFISPQVWASRPWRMKKIAQTVKKMLVIFPFEEKLYRDMGIDARFIGHPLTSNLPAPESLMKKEQFCSALQLDPARKTIVVFPGSRKSEIRDLLPVTLDAIDWILASRNDVQFVISQANTMVEQSVKDLIAKYRFKSNGAAQRVRTAVSSQSYDLMANADLVWAKSGTTTLEVTLFGKPMLVFYRVMWLTWIIALGFMRLRRVSWPNLLAGEDLVPELIQLDCRAEQLVRYTNDLLDVPALGQKIRQRLLALRSQLGQGEYAANCAEEILKVIERSPAATQQSQANV